MGTVKVSIPGQTTGVPPRTLLLSKDALADLTFGAVRKPRSDLPTTVMCKDPSFTFPPTTERLI